MGSPRARRSARRNSASDLGARVWVAIPAAVYAILIVWQGDWIFAARRAPPRLRVPARAVPHVRPRPADPARRLPRRDRPHGRRPLRGRAPGAPGHRRVHPGDLPARARAARAHRPAAHRRHGDHAARDALDRPGHRLRGAAARAAPRRRDRHRRARSGRSSATRRPTSAAATSACASSRRGSRPNKTVEGLVFGVLGGDARGVVRRALPGLDRRRGLGPARPRRSASWRRSATCSSRRSSAMRGPRMRVRCSVRTAARWTGWTPRCSPWWGGTTCGWC